MCGGESKGWIGVDSEEKSNGGEEVKVVMSRREVSFLDK